MFFKKIVTFFIIVNILFSSLWAGELKIKNDNAIPIEVTVRAKDNNGADNPFTVIQVIEPSEEITVIIDEKKFSATTFFIQGVTITTFQVMNAFFTVAVVGFCLLLEVMV